MYDINTFIPFQHENHDAKNQLLNLARSQGTELQGIFTSVLIYTNLVDYLAKNVLDNLRKMISIFSYKSFGATFCYDPSQKRIDISLGELRKELDSFNFPDKKEFLDCLNEFSRSRNRIMHNLMQIDLNNESTTSQFNNDLTKISQLAEQILTKYNIIIQGITTAWTAVNSN